MKLLFDENLSARLCPLLSDLFPGAQHVRLAGLEQADDTTVWRYASQHGLVIVTLDADFAELAALRGTPPKVIWLRCGNQRTATIEALLRRHAAFISAFEQDTAACLEIY